MAVCGRVFIQSALILKVSKDEEDREDERQQRKSQRDRETEKQRQRQTKIDNEPAKDSQRTPRNSYICVFYA